MTSLQQQGHPHRPTLHLPSTTSEEAASSWPSRPFLRPGQPVASSEERHRLISEIAYENAKRRGFVPGGELEDWLAAEREVDTWFEGPCFSGD